MRVLKNWRISIAAGKVLYIGRGLSRSWLWEASVLLSYQRPQFLKHNCCITFQHPLIRILLPPQLRSSLPDNILSLKSLRRRPAAFTTTWYGPAFQHYRVSSSSPVSPFIQPKGNVIIQMEPRGHLFIIHVTQTLRGLCTDPTWRSPECPSYCMEFSWAAYPMTTCEGITGSAEDHCCELASLDCCQTAGRRFKVTPQSPGVWATFVGGEYSVVGSVVEVGETSSSSTLSSTTSVEPMTVTISRGSAKASERPNGDEVKGEEEEEEEEENDEISGASVSTAAKVGIGVGVVAGTVLVIAVIWLAYNNRKQRNVNNSLKSMNKFGQLPHGTQPPHGFYWQSHQQQTPPISRESSNQLPAQELPGYAGNQSRSELSG
ncbi:hypothetical protein NLU13_4209 [Sarocladium strictum]|uniref:Uncharacterized protein n=1 Tax=Sarocladium strictum TaxID=5046 RepID=A0AA39L8L5_SARSR|nr:hypothetical protein NLU13_4209 [Sarocladium strictum]